MRLLRSFAIVMIAGTYASAVACAQSAGVKAYLGFDANAYPGDDHLAALHQRFAFTGFWLNNPPGASHNLWAGKRDAVRRAGLGFAVLFNGRLDHEILAAQKAGRAPAILAKADAVVAVSAAKREGFPAGTIVFLDQEEGGRMLPEQAAYLLGWTEAVAASGYKPGLYASGQPVQDEDEHGRKVTITTLSDIRARVTAQHLHPIVFWTIQDACPPAPGCVLDPAKTPRPTLSGTMDTSVWQFAQSPQRQEYTRACTATYSRGNCYPPETPAFRIDLDSASSPDPSRGR